MGGRDIPYEYADEDSCKSSDPERPETGVRNLDGYCITFMPDSTGLGYDQWPVTFTISSDEAAKLHAALDHALYQS